MPITIHPFGNINGTPISQYVISNEKGVTLKVINYGATITSVSLPDKNGGRVEIVAGFDTLKGYLSDAYHSNSPFFGCTIGRFANRIGNSSFELDKKYYNLEKNEGNHHIHGGPVGFDKNIWEGNPIEHGGNQSVEMRLKSPHLDQGFPGNLFVSVTYILTDANELEIRYNAKTDRTTPVSLTNHTYFNLTGFKETIHSHKAMIYSEKILHTDDKGIPDGNFVNVENTHFDFRRGNYLKEGLDKTVTGFDHYFVFDKPFKSFEKVAIFEDEKSGRRLELWTDEPGMQFYTANHISDKLHRENGDRFGKFCGFCCETHKYPNGPNLKNAPAVFLYPGEEYVYRTTFKFKL